MILSTEVEITVSISNVKYYESLGYLIPKRKSSKRFYRETDIEYVYDYGSKIKVKVADLSSYSRAMIQVKCDVCDKELTTPYCKYIANESNQGYYVCTNKECVKTKRENTNLKKFGVKYPAQSPQIKAKTKKIFAEKYGVENPTSLPEIKQKAKQTIYEQYGVTNLWDIPGYREKYEETVLNNYGVKNVSQSEIIKQKKKDTLMANYGVDNPLKSDVIKERIIATNIERYGVTNPSKNPEICSKITKSFEGNKSQRVSQQQLYLNNLFGGKLNKAILNYNCDIVFEEEKIVLEYNGGGHDLGVKFKQITEKDFKQKEIVRDIQIKRLGYKMVKIISRTDKLPSDSKLLEILDFSRQYFKDYPNHSWIEWHLDDGLYRNAEHKDGVPYDFGELRRVRKEDIA